jgi:membrane-bound lytic murein transglycosylase D
VKVEEKLPLNTIIEKYFIGLVRISVMLLALVFVGCSTGQVASERPPVAEESVSVLQVSEPPADSPSEAGERVAPEAAMLTEALGAGDSAGKAPENAGLAPGVVEEVVEVEVVGGSSLPPPNPMGIEVPERQEVADVISEFKGPNRRVIDRGIERSRRYREYIGDILTEKGLPQGLFVLPMVESSFRTDAYSHAGAAGMWQFIDSTARMSGLRVDWWVDERLDWRASTRAAVDHLGELYERFGDWELSLAAYNAGPGGVGRAISKGGADFWQLCDLKLLRQETRRYVPKFYALMQIFSDPEAFGFEPGGENIDGGVDEVKVDSPVDLRTVSRIAGVGEGALARLNPALLRGCTPPGGGEYSLRAPTGKGGRVSAELAKLGAVERLDFKRHRVAAGDTLWKIAKRYSTRIDAIAELNRLDNPKLIRPGKELVVPVRKGMQGYSDKGPVSFEGRLVHVVRRGDSLWRISRRYDVKIADLLSWNRLTNKSKIFEGNKLFVSHASASLASRQGAVHVVEAGDTLWSISRSRGVTVGQLRHWNGMEGADLLRPGDKLRVTPLAD